MHGFTIVFFFYYVADDRARRPSTERLSHSLHSKVTDRASWRQTVEKVGDPPNFTKPLLPLKAKGNIFSTLL